MTAQGFIVDGRESTARTSEESRLNLAIDREKERVREEERAREEPREHAAEKRS